MRILTAYMFCTNGGVETALKNRIKQIASSQLQLDLLFLSDYGGRHLFDDIACNVFIENNHEKIAEIINNGHYDAIVSIDTPEVLDLLQKIQYAGVIGLEVHTTYTQSLQYLKHLKPNLVSFVIVPSAYQQSLVNEFISQEIRTYILPNSINVNMFCPKPVPVKHDRPILVWVGRLDQHKNWELYLDIAAEMHQQSKGLFEYWLIGGMKSEVSQIEAFSEKLRTNDLHTVFRWVPYLPYHCMPTMYSYVSKAGGCYISTSSNESFGMTVIEAMACCCPVVGNNVGALSELIMDTQNGLLINMGQLSASEIASQLIQHLHDSVKLQKAVDHANQFVHTFFDEQTVQRQYVDILQKEVTELSIASAK